MKILIHLLFFLPALLGAQDLPTISRQAIKVVEFTVIDPEGQPVESALVEASRPGPGNNTGRTGKDGKVRLELVESATLYLHVSREGFYTTGGQLWRGGMHKGPDRDLVPRILPDSFEILLKPVLDPVPMIEMQYSGSCPLTDRPMPFDLALGDWVSPYGNGRKADLYFNFHDISNAPNAYSGVLTILFPNPRDGIQPFQAARPYSMEFGSNLAPPNRAPVDGYTGELRLSVGWKTGDPAPLGRSTGKNYLFRIRSIQGTDGRLREACYGWIQGEIEFDPRGRFGPQLKFQYALNPDPAPEARSLEREGARP